jgi:hypothetical protein
MELKEFNSAYPTEECRKVVEYGVLKVVFIQRASRHGLRKPQYNPGWLARAYLNPAAMSAAPFFQRDFRLSQQSVQFGRVSGFRHLFQIMKHLTAEPHLGIAQKLAHQDCESYGNDHKPFF